MTLPFHAMQKGRCNGHSTMISFIADTVGSPHLNPPFEGSVCPGCPGEGGVYLEVG